MNDIRINPVSAYQFDQWGEELQEEFLDFCTGARGVKMTYDSFFKEIMNPGTTCGTFGRTAILTARTEGKDPSVTAESVGKNCRLKHVADHGHCCGIGGWQPRQY